MSDRAVTSSVPSHAVIFRPVDTSERPEAIVERLQSAISVGVLADGEVLPNEQDLARLFDVPPFRLREALRILRDQGLIVTRRGRGGGSFVRLPEGLNYELASERLQSLATVEIRDVCDWRHMLTIATVRLAAERADEMSVSRLREHAHRLVEAESPADARRAHSRYYLELAASSQSVRMSSAEMDLQAQFGWLFGVVIDSASYRSAAGSWFAGIADGIESGETSAALDQAATHSDYLSGRLLAQRMSVDIGVDSL